MRRLARLVSALLLALVARQAQSGETLVVGDQKGGSQALMEAAGVLADVPYRIEWKEFAAAAPLLEALNAGAIDTGVVGDAPFTFAVASGLRAKAIAAVRENEAGLAILVRKGSPITNADGLKGKTIATGHGSIGQRLILALAEKEGWSKDAVRTVFLQPADAQAATARGSVDAWATWEPYVAQEEVLFGARRVATGEGLAPGLTFQLASDAAIAGKRAALADFIGRQTRARTWALTHVDAYASAWGKLFGIDAKIPTLWLTRARITPVPLDASVVADEQETIDLYQRSGLIGTRLDAKGMFDESFAARP